jgi:hypothetical protein
MHWRAGVAASMAQRRYIVMLVRSGGVSPWLGDVQHAQTDWLRCKHPSNEEEPMTQTPNDTPSTAVYVQTNTAPNEVIAFRRAEDG